MPMACSGLRRSCPRMPINCPWNRATCSRSRAAICSTEMSSKAITAPIGDPSSPVTGAEDARMVVPAPPG